MVMSQTLKVLDKWNFLFTDSAISKSRHHLSSYCVHVTKWVNCTVVQSALTHQDISFWTTNANLLVTQKEKSDDHQRATLTLWMPWQSMAYVKVFGIFQFGLQQWPARLKQFIQQCRIASTLAFEIAFHYSVTGASLLCLYYTKFASKIKHTLWASCDCWATALAQQNWRN